MMNESDSLIKENISILSNNYPESHFQAYHKTDYVRCYICGLAIAKPVIHVHEGICKANYTADARYIAEKYYLTDLCDAKNIEYGPRLFRSSWQRPMRSIICSETKSGENGLRKSFGTYRRSSLDELLEPDRSPTLRESRSTESLIIDEPTIIDDDYILDPRLILGLSSNESLTYDGDALYPPFLTPSSRPSSPRKRPSSCERRPGEEEVTCSICMQFYTKSSIVNHTKQCGLARMVMQRRSLSKIESFVKRDIESNPVPRIDRKPRKRSRTQIPPVRPGSYSKNNCTKNSSPSLRRTNSSESLCRTNSNQSLCRTRSSSRERIQRETSPRTKQPQSILKKGNLNSGQTKPALICVSSKMRNLSVTENSPRGKKCVTYGSLPTNSRKPNATTLASKGLHKCYICGQLYGSRSLSIHEKQCYAKEKRAQEALETLGRKKCPQKVSF